LFESCEHASDGSATWSTPQIPDPFIATTKLASVSSNEKDMLFPIKITFAHDIFGRITRRAHKKPKPARAFLKLLCAILR
jgi:hypothetical protein